MRIDVVASADHPFSHVTLVSKQALSASRAEHLRRSTLVKSAPEFKGSILGGRGSLVDIMGCRWMADCEWKRRATGCLSRYAFRNMILNPMAIRGRIGPGRGECYVHIIDENRCCGISRPSLFPRNTLSCYMLTIKLSVCQGAPLVCNA